MPNFTVEWTLTVNTELYANVTVDDVGGSEIFSGQADSQRKVSVVLPQYLQEAAGRTYRTPPGWLILRVVIRVEGR